MITPAWIVAGAMLWRHAAWGYAIGVSLLFQAGLLFLSLIIVMLLPPLLAGGPFASADMAVIFLMGLVCWVPLGLFVRGVAFVETGRANSANKS